jgi:uncharacterized repeat protein (TIGR01451 family)
MRFLKTYPGGARGWIGAGLLAMAVAGIALAGGAATGRAAASPAVAVDSFTVLNDDADKFEPTAGGNIGYVIHVTNGGTSVANHLSLTETIGKTGALAYVSATVNGLPAAICNTPGPSVSTLTCTLTKLDVGGTIQVTALFRTNPSASPGDPVQDTAVLAFDSQTNGQANRKTTTYLSPLKAIAGLADGSLAQSVFLPGDDLGALGAGQTSELAMPGGSFVNGFPYVGGSLQNGPAPALCLKCPAFATVITIPHASSFTTSGPFYDGTNQKPFTWILTLKPVPNGYKYTGVYHNGTLILACDDPSAPLTTTGLCVSNVAQTKQQIKVTGLAFTNGNYQFG